MIRIPSFSQKSIPVIVRTVDFFIRLLAQKLLKSYVPINAFDASFIFSTSSGAYKWGLTCPEKFAAIGGVAGSYHAEYRYQGKVNTVSTLCEALYGDPPAITPEVHDVFTLLKNRKEEGRDIPRLYTCCGTEDRRHQDSVDLKEFADQLGVPLLFEEGPGRHDDIFFDEYIQKILDWMNFAGKSVEE